MNALLIQYLTGMQPTKCVTLLNELGVTRDDGTPVKSHQLQYARKNLKAGDELLGDEATDTLMDALNDPKTELQKEASSCYLTLMAFFDDAAPAEHDTPYEEPTEAEGEAAWAELGSDDSVLTEEDLAPWDEIANIEVVQITDPLTEIEPSTKHMDVLSLDKDDPFADLEIAVEPEVTPEPAADDSDPFAALLDTPAVGAEPVEYDRTALEKDNDGKPVDFEELLKPDAKADPFADLGIF